MSLDVRITQIKEKIILLVNKPWMHFVWLFLITTFAAALRFYKLGVWSFWIDEIYTVNHATAHFSNPALILDNIPPARNWIPISIILTAQILNIWGITEWSARLASTLIGVLTIPALYIPTQKIFGKHVALVAVLLLAISPWHLFWSQNARFYTSLLLFYSLALYSFHVGIEEDKPKYLLLFFLLVYLAASERLTALFIFPVVLIYLGALWVFKFERPRGLNYRNLAITFLPAILGFIVEIFFRLARGESRFFADFTWFTQHQIDDPFRLLVFIGNNIGIPLVVLSAFSGIHLIVKKDRSGLLMTVSAFAPLIMLVILNLFIFTKDRYIFITLFNWIILAAIGLKEVIFRLKDHHRWLAIGFFFIFLAHGANDMLLYYQANHGNRLPWKSAFATVKEQIGKDDVIVSFWPELGLYYLDREILAYADVDVNILRDSSNNFWFVLDSETIWTNNEMKSWLESNAELVNVWYLRRPEDNFLRVYRVDPNRNK